MKICVDTSAIISVLTEEKTKSQIISLTKGATLIAPASVPWEIGNAISLMFKKSRINLNTGIDLINIFNQIPIRFLETNMKHVLEISNEFNLYAYDAYFLSICLDQSIPLLSLDRKLNEIADKLRIKILLEN